MIKLSAVIPVRNEAENLRELVARLTHVFSRMGLSHEIIFVTDLNTDTTVDVLGELHREYPCVKALKLSNAFGHHAAVMAGLQRAQGDAVVIMDGDLQDHPEDIPLLYAKMQEGFDVVYGIKERKNESVLRNILSQLFVRILRWLSDYRMEVNTSMFRIISRRMADAVLQFKEREPSLTFIMGLIGFPTACVRVTSGTRVHGKTSYGFGRQVNFAMSSLVSFSTKPLRIISMFGLCVSVVALVYFVVVVLQQLIFGVPVHGWPTLASLLCFLCGVQLLALGVIGEYSARVFMETKQRPRYIVEKMIGQFERMPRNGADGHP